MLTDSIDSAIDDLASDVEKAIAMLHQQDSQFNRRIYVRALFAYLEGFTYWIRQNAIEIDKITFKNSVSINFERHILLHEELPTIAENGKIESKKQKISFKNRFSFSLRAFAEIVQCKDDFFSDNGWTLLLKGLKVRDRLMHPKKSSDLIVSDDEAKACIEGYKWFVNLMVTKLRKSADAMINKI